jgi:hypothetical protein
LHIEEVFLAGSVETKTINKEKLDEAVYLSFPKCISQTTKGAEPEGWH